MSTLCTFWGFYNPYRAQSVHFLGLMNSATKRIREGVHAMRPSQHPDSPQHLLPSLGRLLRYRRFSLLGFMRDPLYQDHSMGVITGSFIPRSFNGCKGHPSSSRSPRRPPPATTGANIKPRSPPRPEADDERSLRV